MKWLSPSPWKWSFFLGLSYLPWLCPPLGRDLSQQALIAHTKTPRPVLSLGWIWPVLKMGTHKPEFNVHGNRELAPERRAFSKSFRHWLLRASSGVTVSYDLHPRGGWDKTHQRRPMHLDSGYYSWSSLYPQISCYQPRNSYSLTRENFLLNPEGGEDLPCVLFVTELKDTRVGSRGSALWLLSA